MLDMQALELNLNDTEREIKISALMSIMLAYLHNCEKDIMELKRELYRLKNPPIKASEVFPDDKKDS